MVTTQHRDHMVNINIHIFFMTGRYKNTSIVCNYYIVETASVTG